MSRPNRTNALLASAVFLLAVHLPVLAAPLKLTDFEAGLTQQAAYRLAVANHAVAEANAEREAANGGLRAYGGLSGGSLYEPQYGGGARDYGSFAANAGLRYPILGSASEEQARVGNARIDALLADNQRDDETQRQLRQLREAFFGYASAQAAISLSQAFLADAAKIREVLRLRQDAGLILEGERRQLEGGFALATRHLRHAETQQAQREQALRSWRPDFDGQIALPADTVTHAAPAAAAPEAAPQTRLEALVATLPHSQSGTRASLFVSGNLRHDTDLGNASALLAGISVELPIGGPSIDQGLLGERDARIERARAQLALRVQQKRVALEQDKAEFQRSLADRELAQHRLASSAASLREAARRARLDQGLDDAPIERWVSTRIEHFNALAGLIEAEQRVALAGALLEIGAPQPQGDTRMRLHGACLTDTLAILSWRTLQTAASSVAASCATPASAEARTRTAYYAWQGVSALEQTRDATFRTQLAGPELWLSFSRAEFDRLQEPAWRERIRRDLESLKQAGQRRVLLLGEPSWLLAGREPQLDELLRGTRDLPFDVIHLDVEPEQIKAKLPAEQAWPALAKLVKRVRKQTGKPVILSVHWKAVTPDATGRCAACAAASAADEIAVMLYSTAASTINERMLAILAGKPSQRVWLAQSIEPALAPDESFATQGRAALEQLRRTLGSFTEHPNFAGFAVQSLEDYLEAQP